MAQNVTRHNCRASLGSGREEPAVGGTIIDISSHAMDLIPWLTGAQVAEVIAARNWNAGLSRYPHFKNAGQLMFRLDNGGGLGVDASVPLFCLESLGREID